MRGNAHVRFGGRAGETDRRQRRHRAPVRPYLANRVIDDVRRRVQVETTGHRGRKHDPLYRIRKILLVAGHRLNETAATKLDAGLAAGDPYDEVACTYLAKELLRGVHAAPDIFAARRALERFFDWAAEIDVPEVTRLATTIDHWRVELLAYFRTGGASSGPVEAVNGELEQIDRAAADSGTTTTTAPGCCSRPLCHGRLPPHQDSGVAALKCSPPPPLSSRRARNGEHDPDNGLESVCWNEKNIGITVSRVAASFAECSLLMHHLSFPTGRDAQSSRPVSYTVVLTLDRWGQAGACQNRAPSCSPVQSHHGREASCRWGSRAFESSRGLQTRWCASSYHSGKVAASSPEG
jgi:hypothetical protein